MEFITPSLFISFFIVAVVQLNRWNRREDAELTKEELKKIDDEILFEDSFW